MELANARLPPPKQHNKVSYGVGDLIP